ncbi:hypothetical protein WMY93_021696 [Mugilogobius chulae]|uniref:Uncharacterized protein n=1 Tax=Mugilogobius chulae TaxID=88201 RepID=A0AAW0NH67_9GOBI
MSTVDELIARPSDDYRYWHCHISSPSHHLSALADRKRACIVRMGFKNTMMGL